MCTHISTTGNFGLDECCDSARKKREGEQSGERGVERQLLDLGYRLTQVKSGCNMTKVVYATYKTLLEAVSPRKTDSAATIAYIKYEPL